MLRLLAILYYLLPVLIQNVYSQGRVEIYVQGCVNCQRSECQYSV